MRTYEQQTIWASLDEIRIGKRTVARLSVPTVELYRVWLEHGRDAPPVRLARHGDAFVVRDGPPPSGRRPGSRTHRDRGGGAPHRSHPKNGHGLDPPRSSEQTVAARPHPGDALWEHLSLAPSRTWVRFPPSPCSSGLRGVNGKHAPFVWTRCGFNSCRRLSNARSSADSSTVLRGQRALVRIQPGVFTRT